jgi:GT2 family glycosyltransferase
VEVAERAAVGILTWRGEAHTRVCLESLRCLEQWPNDIVIVDNGSGTDEGSRLATEFGVESLSLPKNGGVAYGYNAAIDWARSRGCSHVLLLNNDTVIEEPRLLGFLLAATDGRVAAVGPVVETDAGVIWSAGGVVQWWSGRVFHRRTTKSAAPYEVDWIDGSAILVNTQAACVIGGFSEDFFLYWEETDWATRAARAGFRCVIQPAALIRHQRGASATTRQTRTYSLRNALLFMRRNGSAWANASSFFVYMLIRTPLFVLRRLREGSGLREALRDALGALGWNIGDALARRRWRRPADGPDLCAPSREGVERA